MLKAYLLNCFFWARSPEEVIFKLLDPGDMTYIVVKIVFRAM